ncbi:hypothetical protein [Enhygromyxa salina]|nr:hypothetical protein [Enhygromyxa salina]
MTREIERQPPHAELSRELDAVRRTVGGARPRAQRRRYLYEIEFFDAHPGRPRAALASQLAVDESDPARPLDPRLREIITAAACGWVIGSVKI